MRSEQHCQTFPLRIPASTRAVAAAWAQREGVSLNYFILVAISERVTRLRMDESFCRRAAELEQPATVLRMTEPASK